MKYPGFFLVQISFLLLSLICMGFVYVGLKKVLPRTAFSLKKKARISSGFLLASSVWILVLMLLSFTGFLGNFESFPPRMMIVLAIPFISILFITFSKGMREILYHTPAHWLVFIQSFRIPVEILLWWLFISHLIPQHMTFEGRNLDVLSGLLALPAGYILLSTSSLKKITGIAFNILGLLLLMNIVTIAILSLPTPMRVFMEEPSNTIVATFPVVLLPGILVPLAYSMHFFSLRQMLLVKVDEQPNSAHAPTTLPL